MMFGVHPKGKKKEKSGNRKKQSRQSVGPQQQGQAIVKKPSIPTAQAYHRPGPGGDHPTNSTLVSRVKIEMSPTRLKPLMSHTDGYCGPNVSRIIPPMPSHFIGPTQTSGQSGDNSSLDPLSRLIATKFDSVINSIDGETFSGQERDLSMFTDEIYCLFELTV